MGTSISGLNPDAPKDHTQKWGESVQYVNEDNPYANSDDDGEQIVGACMACCYNNCANCWMVCFSSCSQAASTSYAPHPYGVWRVKVNSNVLTKGDRGATENITSNPVASNSTAAKTEETESIASNSTAGTKTGETELATKQSDDAKHTSGQTKLIEDKFVFKWAAFDPDHKDNKRTTMADKTYGEDHSFTWVVGIALGYFDTELQAAECVDKFLREKFKGEGKEDIYQNVIHYPYFKNFVDPTRFAKYKKGDVKWNNLSFEQFNKKRAGEKLAKLQKACNIAVRTAKNAASAALRVADVALKKVAEVRHQQHMAKLKVVNGNQTKKKLCKIGVYFNDVPNTAYINGSAVSAVSAVPARAVGTCVEIFGLEKGKKFNGMKGKVVELVDGEMCKVAIDGDKVRKLRWKNLKATAGMEEFGPAVLYYEVGGTKHPVLPADGCLTRTLTAPSFKGTYLYYHVPSEDSWAQEQAKAGSWVCGNTKSKTESVLLVCKKDETIKYSLSAAAKLAHEEMAREEKTVEAKKMALIQKYNAWVAKRKREIEAARIKEEKRKKAEALKIAKAKFAKKEAARIAKDIACMPWIRYPENKPTKIKTRWGNRPLKEIFVECTLKKASGAHPAGAKYFRNLDHTKSIWYKSGWDTDACGKGFIFAGPNVNDAKDWVYGTRWQYAPSGIDVPWPAKMVFKCVGPDGKFIDTKDALPAGAVEVKRWFQGSGDLWFPHIDKHEFKVFNWKDDLVGVKELPKPPANVWAKVYDKVPTFADQTCKFHYEEASSGQKSDTPPPGAILGANSKLVTSAYVIVPFPKKNNNGLFMRNGRTLANEKKDRDKRSKARSAELAAEKKAAAGKKAAAAQAAQAKAADERAKKNAAVWGAAESKVLEAVKNEKFSNKRVAVMKSVAAPLGWTPDPFPTLWKQDINISSEDGKTKMMFAEHVMWSDGFVSWRDGSGKLLRVQSDGSLKCDGDTEGHDTRFEVQLTPGEADKDTGHARVGFCAHHYKYRGRAVISKGDGSLVLSKDVRALDGGDRKCGIGSNGGQRLPHKPACMNAIVSKVPFEANCFFNFYSVFYQNFLAVDPVTGVLSAGSKKLKRGEAECTSNHVFTLHRVVDDNFNVGKSSLYGVAGRQALLKGKDNKKRLNYGEKYAFKSAVSGRFIGPAQSKKRVDGVCLWTKATLLMTDKGSMRACYKGAACADPDMKRRNPQPGERKMIYTCTHPAAVGLKEPDFNKKYNPVAIDMFYEGVDKKGSRREEKTGFDLELFEGKYKQQFGIHTEYSPNMAVNGFHTMTQNMWTTGFKAWRCSTQQGPYFQLSRPLIVCDTKPSFEDTFVAVTGPTYAKAQFSAPSKEVVPKLGPMQKAMKSGDLKRCFRELPGVLAQAQFKKESSLFGRDFLQYGKLLRLSAKDKKKYEHEGVGNLWTPYWV